MYDLKETEQMKGWLVAIHNTKLLANSKDEFGEMISRNDVKSNSISKILDGQIDFYIHSTFHELSSIVSEKTNGLIRLDGWLKAYERTSDYYYSRKTFWKGKDCDAKRHSLLEYIIFGESDVYKNYDCRWNKAWEDAEENTNLEILLLMSLQILPYYSGKGKVEDNPVKTLSDFVLADDYLGDIGVINALLSNDMDVCDRLKSVVILHNVVTKIRNSMGAELERDMYNNVKEMTGIDVNDDDEQPILLSDGKHPFVFWYLASAMGAYFLYKCDAKQHLYTRYLVLFGSEFGEQYGRVLHPLFMTDIINGEDEVCRFMIMKWTAETTNSRNMKRIDSVRINTVHSWCKCDAEMANEFADLELRRMSFSDGVYQSCASYMKKTAVGWTIMESFNNAFPGSDYFFSLTLHGITYQGNVLVDDVKFENGVWDRDEETQYLVGAKWLGDKSVTFTDYIGVMVLGTDLPKDKWKRYLAIDYMQYYFPIVDGNVVFPDEEE